MGKVGAAYDSLKALDDAEPLVSTDKVTVLQAAANNNERATTMAALITFLTGTFMKGVIADNQVPFGDGIELTGSDDLTWDGTTLGVVGDVQTTKNSVTRSLEGKPDEVEEIGSMADFPDAVAGVRTLVAGKTYRILAALTTSDRFVLPTGSTINFESGTFNIGISITYTGTGTLFTGTDITALQIFGMAFLNTGSGTLFNISAGVSNFPFVTFNTSLAFGWASVGTVTNVLYFADSSAFVNCTAGITMVDPLNINLILGAYFNTSDLGTIFFDIQGTGFVTLACSQIRTTGRAGEFIFKVANGIDDASSLRFVNNEFINANLFDPAGRDKTDPAINTLANAGQPDSFTIGSYIVDSNTTATTFAGNSIFTDFDFNALAIAGDNIELFTLTDTTTGELTYNGVEDFDGTITFIVYCTSTGGAVDFEIRLVLNGSELTDIFHPGLNIGNGTKAFPVSVPVCLVTGDTIRPQVQRLSGTSSLTATHASMSIN